MHFLLQALKPKIRFFTRDTWWREFDTLANTTDKKSKTLELLHAYPKLTRIFPQKIGKKRQDLWLWQHSRNIIPGTKYIFLWAWVHLRTTTWPLFVFLMGPPESQHQWKNFINMPTPQNQISMTLKNLLPVIMQWITKLKLPHQL